MKVRSLLPLGLAILIGALGLITLWRGSLAQAQPTPPPYDPAAAPTPALPPAAASGASLFAQNCAPCHGPQGDSDGPTTASLPAPPPRFSDPATVWQRSPAEYFHITKFGNLPKLMPPWGNRLSDEQIWQAVYYAWTLHTDQQQVQAGADLYAQSCAACHGPTGAGDGAEATGALPDFSDPGQMSLRTQAELDAGWRLAHAELGQEWSESERRNVLNYIRSLSYLPPWESAYRPGAGRIAGAVVQGTSDGAAVGVLPVTLTAYINFAPTESFTTTSDASGQFLFDQLATEGGVVYLASTEYDGIRYNSDIISLSSLTPTQSITLPVYETSADGRAVHISRANWLVDFEPGALRVGLILAFSNQSDRTFIGQPVEGVNGPATVGLAVPPGAGEIEFSEGVLGGRFQQAGDAVYDTAPVPPGAEVRQIIYSYRLPVEGDSAEFEQRFLYPVASLNLLVTDLPGLVAEAPDLTSVGVEKVQNVNFRRWVAEALRNPALRLQLRNIPAIGPVNSPDSSGAGMPPPGFAPATPPISPVVAASMGGLLVIVLAGLLYWPLRRQAALDQGEALTRQRDELINQIAALDDEHAAGNLSTNEWSQQRAQLKSTLLVVAQQVAQKEKVIG
jgi:mono/diheme cytochrome c family protein